MINTNAIRAFADKIRAVNSSQGNQLILSAQEARNLNHEIQQLMARLLELQDQATSMPVEVEIKAQKF